MLDMFVGLRKVPADDLSHEMKQEIHDLDNEMREMDPTNKFLLGNDGFESNSDADKGSWEEYKPDEEDSWASYEREMFPIPSTND